MSKCEDEEARSANRLKCVQGYHSIEIVVAGQNDDSPSRGGQKLKCTDQAQTHKARKAGERPKIAVPCLVLGNRLRVCPDASLYCQPMFWSSLIVARTGRPVNDVTCTCRFTSPATEPRARGACLGLMYLSLPKVGPSWTFLLDATLNTKDVKLTQLGRCWQALLLNHLPPMPWVAIGAFYVLVSAPARCAFLSHSAS